MNIVLEAGEFKHIYQGRSSNFREGDNLTERIEMRISEGDMKDVDLKVFSVNMVFESAFYKGDSNCFSV